MSALATRVRAALAVVAAAARAALGVVVGAGLATVAFLLVMSQAQERGYTSLRFSHALGMLAGDPGLTGPDGATLLVERISFRGLYVSLLLATALVAAYALLLEPRVRGRRWPLGGACLGLATFLLGGLVYGPLVGARVPAVELGPAGVLVNSVAPADEDVAGLLGLDAGRGTPLALALASLAFGLAAARVYALIRSREWWASPEG